MGASAQTTLTTEYVMLKDTSGIYHKILKSSFTEAIRDVLAKGFPIDLHERAFPPGAAATTVAAHIGAIIWRNEDQDGCASFDIAVFRSLSRSFWHWFSKAAAEFGCEVRPS